jgi:hypothetical protein
MADVITRFKLETTQFDSKLRDAAKGLREIGRMAEIGGKDFVNFSQKQVEAARQLGQTASGATNAKDKVRDLVGAFNEAAKAYNNLTQAQQQSDFGKNLSASLTQLKARLAEAKQEMYGLSDSMGKSGGGLFGGDKISGMLQVFGGNVLTKIAGVGVGFATELGDMVKQGIELAKAGEGVRIAFERLGRGDILQGLREATHGTVTDLELMKSAVKFNDFKLPIEELGTMLAFAQQKAKDTGQSVDYMVDSIVTGLGRKSLMILDNLGLSAEEIKEKMKETGDMTKAVGAIIREQMAKSGDYIETTADRAAQADVKLKNAMEELGRTFQPLSDSANSMWTDIKVGALDLINSAINPLINKFTELGRIRQQYADQGGDERVQRQLNRLRGIGTDIYRRGTYKAQLANYDTKIGSYQQYLADYKTWGKDKTAVGAYDRMQAFQKQTGLSTFSDVKEQLAVFQKMRSEYVKGAKAIIQANPAPSPAASGDGKGNTTIKTGSNFNASLVAFTGGEGTKWTPQNMPSVWAMMGDHGLRNMMGIGSQQEDLGRLLKEFVTDPDKNRRNQKKSESDEEKTLQDVSTIVGAVGNIASGIQSLGIELPEELTKGIAILQTMSGIISAILAITTLIKGEQTVQTTASVVDAIIPFARGGVVKAASGTVVGNTYSNDQILTALNAGEVVLNKAQTAALAASFSNEGADAGSGPSFITGEQIYVVLNRYLSRIGEGELVTWKH